jgi:CCAAT-binding transcription factor (CBF-B/NF-YA) subunit B
VVSVNTKVIDSLVTEVKTGENSSPTPSRMVGTVRGRRDVQNTIRTSNSSATPTTDVISSHKPKVRPMKVNFQPSSTPPLEVPLPPVSPDGSHKPKVRPSQSDAVLIDFMGGFQHSDTARKSGNKHFASDQEEEDAILSSTRVEVTVEKAKAETNASSVVKEASSDKDSGGNKALQDYQEQLLLLEGPRQKPGSDNRLIIGQGHDIGITKADIKTIAQIDFMKLEEERKKELAEQQMSLVSRLNCRQRNGEAVSSSYQPITSRHIATGDECTASISANDTQRLEFVDVRNPDPVPLNCQPVSNLAASEDVLRDFDFDTFLSQDGMGNRDVLQDFDFDSFLAQDGMNADKTVVKHNVASGEAKESGSDLGPPEAQNSAAATKIQEHDASSVVGSTDSGSQFIAPGITQTDLENPLFINPKQFNRIITRRVARQKFQEAFKRNPGRAGLVRPVAVCADPGAQVVAS